MWKEIVPLSSGMKIDFTRFRHSRDQGDATVDSVSDNDLQLLEGYLDDALTEAEIDALRQRLAVEPALSAALVQLRGERSLRQSFWQELEPAEAAGGELMG